MRKIKRGTALLFKEPRRFAGRIWGPRILVTSVPKSGTNLLVHTLSLFPQLTFDGTTARQPEDTKFQMIRNIRRGCIVSSHNSRSPELDTILNQKKIKVLFIIRDPRDVSVSLYHWIKKTKYHYFHDTYNDLSSDHERFEKIITGYKPEFSDRNNKGIVSIDYHFRRRLSWMDDRNCLTVRFEDLIGSFGGGEKESQMVTLKSIAEFLNLNLTNQDFQYIGDKIFSPRTATFRKGKIGSWREEFTEDHKIIFKEVAGQLLIDLGYEKDLNW